jgi:ATP-dependent Clp protease ATP-binding subunit ClpA
MTDDGASKNDEQPIFPAEVQEIIHNAESEVHLLGHNWVGTEHLLLALFSSELTYDTFLRLGLGKAEILAAVNRNRRFEDTISNDFGHTVEFKQVLDAAIQEAGRENKVTHVHLLLGLFAEPIGGIEKLLIELRLPAPMVYERIQISIKRDYPSPNFSHMAKWALTFSEDEARNRSRVYIDADHVLLGLVREQKGVGGKVLREIGVTYDILTQHSVSAGDSHNHPSKPLASKLTGEVRSILQAAVNEARIRTSHFSYGEGMNTGHILLGIVRKRHFLENIRKSSAIELLKRAGFDPENIRQEVRRALQEHDTQ